MEIASIVGAIVGGLVPTTLAFFLTRWVLLRWLLPAHANVVAGLFSLLACGTIASYVLDATSQSEARTAELWLAYFADAVLLVVVRSMLDRREVQVAPRPTKAEPRTAASNITTVEPASRTPAEVSPPRDSRLTKFAIALSVVALLRSCWNGDPQHLETQVIHAHNEAELARRRVDALEERVTVLSAQLEELAQARRQRGSHR